MTCQFVLFVPSRIILQKLNVVFVSMEKLIDLISFLCTWRLKMLCHPKIVKHNIHCRAVTM